MERFESYLKFNTIIILADDCLTEGHQNPVNNLFLIRQFKNKIIFVSNTFELNRHTKKANIKQIFYKILRHCCWNFPSHFEIFCSLEYAAMPYFDCQRFGRHSRDWQTLEELLSGHCVLPRKCLEISKENKVGRRKVVIKIEILEILWIKQNAHTPLGDKEIYVR